MARKKQIVKPQIKGFRLGELRPARYNPRVISDEAMAGLTASIIRFGCVEPVIVNIRSKKNTIIGGHQRWRALQELHGDKFRCMCVTVDLNKANEKLLNLTLNNPHCQGRFVEDLAVYIDKLRKQLPNDKDYLKFRLNKLRAEVKQPEKLGLVPDDEIPKPPKKAKTRPGDLWLLGKHRLLCGDSTKEEDVKRLMNGKKAGMVFTDPPYGVKYEGGSSNEKKRERLKGDNSTDLYLPALQITHANTIAKAPVYLWFAGLEIQAAIQAVIQADYQIRNLLIWHKLKAHYGALNAQYKQKHEPFLYLHKKNNSPYWYGGTTETTVWEIEQASINEYHPTQKPVALAERAIKNSSKEKQTVLDGFLGSGSTLIACEKLNRKCYGMEIEPRYCDVIVKRWQDWTGRKGRLIKGKSGTPRGVSHRGRPKRRGGCCY